ncbi:MAG: ribosomal RNA small subunit methyltransferase A [Desulfurococcales archaeon ex4484_58]|nr:MAG: ribosomal RNA small subunit methyltransferase A [Desulfurococcales archaeon ex4484_58]
MLQPPPLNKRELLRWTQELLKIKSIRPLKRYSQNFVVNPCIILDILKLIDNRRPFIEIGAGLGTLSYYLTRHNRRNNICFEIDWRLANIAIEYVESPSILLVSDALKHDWVYEQIVSNAPYHITSDILVKTAKSNNVMKAIFVFQIDVVDRLLAKPGQRKYGRITILINTLFEVVPGPVYPPKFFYPPPEVSSRLVVLIRRREYDRLIERLENLTRKIFSKRRKRAIKVLTREFNLSENKLLELGIKSTTRVYELSPGVLLRLAEELRDIN